MRHYKLVFSITMLSALALTTPFSVADDAATAAPSAQAAWDAASKVATSGPADVTLVDQAILHVPADMAYIPQKESNELLGPVLN